MGVPLTSATTVPMYMKVPEEARTAGRAAGRVVGAKAMLRLSGLSGAAASFADGPAMVGALFAAGWNDCGLMAAGRCLELPHSVNETKRASAKEKDSRFRCISS